MSEGDMIWLKTLFPKNYIPVARNYYTDPRHVADYHYNQLRSQPKYDAMNRPRGVSLEDWNRIVDSEVRAEILKDQDNKAALALEAKCENAVHLARNPGELKHCNSWELPPAEVMRAAEDYVRKYG